MFFREGRVLLASFSLLAVLVVAGTVLIAWGLASSVEPPESIVTGALVDPEPVAATARRSAESR